MLLILIISLLNFTQKWYNGSMIPETFKPYLWSYDFDKLDKENNKKIIIENILNYADFNSSRQLFNLYTIEEIKDVLNNAKQNSFNKKSYNFWNLILN